jgi:transcription antitermination protein NusB
MATRREAREIAVNILFNYDICELTKSEIWDSYWRISEKQNIENIRDFLRKLVDGTIENLSLIDTEISKVMINWDLDRISITDKAILRLAAFELFFLLDIPVNVVINEAIDLAKYFGTPDSGKFVNGVIDKLKDKRGLYERENSF